MNSKNKNNPYTAAQIFLVVVVAAITTAATFALLMPQQTAAVIARITAPLRGDSTQRSTVAPLATSTPNHRKIYATAMYLATSSYESELPLLFDLVVEYYTDPDVAGDATWIAELGAVTSRLEAIGADIRSLSVPPGMEPLHRELLQVEKWITYAAHAAPAPLTVDYLSNAGDHMQTLARLLESRDWAAMPTSRPADAPTAEDRPRSIGVRVTVTPTLGAVLPRQDSIFPTPTP